MLTSWAPHSLLLPCKEGTGRSTYFCPCPLSRAEFLDNGSFRFGHRTWKNLKTNRPILFLQKMMFSRDVIMKEKHTSNAAQKLK